ncbi:SDR family NAD(P)-dependent oxidoreductase [Phenylobacterium montanum]|uniref:D-xylose 1-dehydrogenase n=1 Tax=Phenylobacterium montanum TaxID=2823693 RepID=A0A975FY94_9CAUL|nr:SDR family NAD(P)-dependent oxidoreductase [Caulobacter sp. S6]QUD87381.1 SDR family oxidoreductase [Caulobacter sp. S6]
MERLAGKVAIVTGAASGIGRASAELFAAEGAHVLAVDRPGAALAFEDARIRVLDQDIAADEAPAVIVEAALEAFGRLDVLYNNAGVSGSVLVSELSDAEWDRVQAVNLRAGFRLCRQAIPHLVAAPHGRIIATASVMAEGTDYGLAAYCASKAGVLGLIRTLALELGKHGVTANAILPGAIQTGMTAASFANPHHAEVWAKKSVLRRLGQPIDIARVALFLASEESGFVTGQAIAVDGGLTLRV